MKEKLINDLLREVGTALDELTHVWSANVAALSAKPECCCGLKDWGDLYPICPELVKSHIVQSCKSCGHDLACHPTAKAKPEPLPEVAHWLNANKFYINFDPTGQSEGIHAICGGDVEEYIAKLTAAHKAELDALKKQLPAEMQHCTILFKECEVGHGWLTATNWVQHDCYQCAHKAERAEKDAEIVGLRKSNELLTIGGLQLAKDRAQAEAKGRREALQSVPVEALQRACAHAHSRYDDADALAFDDRIDHDKRLIVMDTISADIVDINRLIESARAAQSEQEKKA